MGRFHVVRPGPSGLPERDIHLEVSGFVSLLHMVALRAGPHPISPIALRYVIEGRDHALAFDHTFIRLIDPELYERLVPWAEYEWGSPLPCHPHPLITLILTASVDVRRSSFVGAPCADVAGLQCKVFSDPPRHAELEWMERTLVAQAVFDSTELASDGSGLLPFARGMHLAISDGHSLEQVST